jgi:hypothetical protein
METDRVRETQLRRMLSRHGRRLVKSRRRIPAAPGCGVYLVVDVYNHTAERVPPYRSNRFATLDDIEEWLSERNKGARAPQALDSRDPAGVDQTAPIPARRMIDN